MTVFAPFAGRLSDRVGSRGLAAAGMVLVAAGMGQLALVSSAASVWRVLAALATVGLGMAFFVAPNLSAVMGSVDRSELGVASGVRFTMRFGGQGLSIAVLGAIAASQAGPDRGTRDPAGQERGHHQRPGLRRRLPGGDARGGGLALVGALVSLAAKSSEKAGAPGTLRSLPCRKLGELMLAGAGLQWTSDVNCVRQSVSTGREAS